MSSKKTDSSTRPLRLPIDALTCSGAEDWEDPRLFAAPDLMVLRKGKPTVMELVKTIQALTDYTTELIIALVDSCGICNNCGERCYDPVDQVARCELCAVCMDDDQRVHIPGDTLEEAGIPLSAKLEAFPGKEGKITVVAADNDHDISDVPLEFRQMLADIGVCLPELDEHLMLEETVDI